MATALTTPDLLGIICQYQHGVPEDMLPFSALASTYDFPRGAKVVDALFLPWLRIYGFSRLPRLVDAVLGMQDCVLQYAAYFDHIDILQVFQTAAFLPGNLTTLAAGEGHVDVLKYLDKIGYIRTNELSPHHNAQRLSTAAMAAAKHGHLVVLQYLHMMYPMEIWMDNGGPAFSAVAHLEVLQWLMDIWGPTLTATEHDANLEGLLLAAVNQERLATTTWLAEKMQHSRQFSAILRVFASSTPSVPQTHLLVYLEEILDVPMNVLAIVIESNRVDKAALLFEKFKHMNRPEVVREGLALAIAFLHVQFMRWFIDKMDQRDVQVILTDHAISFRYGVEFEASFLEIIQLYEAKGAPLDDAIAHLEEIFGWNSDCRVCHDKILVAWLSDGDAALSGIPSTDLVRLNLLKWLVTHQGGRAIILGRLLPKFAGLANKSSKTCQRLYASWRSLMTSTSTIANNNITIHSVEESMLYQATAAGQEKVVSWLLQDVICGKNKTTIERALEAATSSRQHRLASMLRRALIRCDAE
ncbi:Aste57867_23715 [Aphanomyces stellatus]|uniref:Aste57867_16070 protein n=1 Tax=Aphanomyces stellatus TaxID=120398 RepID=A0A485KI85_9STRA|nr:hypothetical protein As57867_023643 [Aphanomyces stellatus]KAF0688354.1 hypothetical protein As57867_019952 [Aphanomyces stellatus]KAF0692697.1 hypothetical protein As57867_016193 [Aphanomyces stellatus]KAF0692907.1 hypothetical protein As57867_016014 [Aphanomyces stellatus]KAF0701192.1 hypothetical protein As57867_008270 [Aphanomyces stellatus]